MNELSLEPIEGELLPDGKIPTVTPEQVNVLAVIQSVSKIEVLANVEETAAGIIKMKTSYLPIVEKAKRDLEAADKAEVKRVSKIKGIIKFIADRPSDFIGKPSSDILKSLSIAKEEGLESVWNGDFAEFQSEAELTLKDAIERLTIILNGTLKKEAADKEESERLEREKQAEIDAKAAHEDVELAENKSSLVFHETPFHVTHDKETADKMARDVDLDIATESAIIELINDDAGVAEDVAKIIGEPFEVLSEVNEDDCVAIPVKYLKVLISVAEIADENGLLEYAAEYNAIEFAKSLI